MKRVFGYAILEQDDIEQMTHRDKMILLLTYAFVIGATIGLFAHALL